MANGAESAVSQAARVSEIGFAEFTTKLVRDVFEALVASHLEQVQAYITLTQAASESLADYIIATKDAVSEDEALAMLALAAAIETVAQGVVLTDAQADAINATLETPPEANINGANQVAVVGDIDSAAKLTALVQAAKIKIAANRFTILSEMVRQGMLRLVVDNGTIDTRLTFNTYGRTSNLSTSSERNRRTSQTNAGAGFGGLAGFGGVGPGFAGGFGGAGGLGAAIRDTSLTVSAATERSRDVVGTRAQIYGRVRINFKTDFAPLNQGNPGP